MRRGIWIVVVVAASWASAVDLRKEGDRTIVDWPIDAQTRGRVVLRADQRRPLIAEIAIDERPVLIDVDPAIVLTVGTRNLSDRVGWIAFFDNPPKRPWKAFRATLERKPPRVSKHGERTTIIVADLSAGPFKGDLRLTIFPNSPLIRLQAAIRTEQDACAILYDVGLVSAAPPWKHVAWVDNVSDEWRWAELAQSASEIAARNRAARSAFRTPTATLTISSPTASSALPGRQCPPTGRELLIPFEPAERRWVRLEVWDIAVNGAFTQPRRFDQSR